MTRPYVQQLPRMRFVGWQSRSGSHLNYRVRVAFQQLAKLVQTNAPFDEVQGATEYLLDMVRAEKDSN